MDYIVTKETLIGDILDHDRTTAEFFLEMGMHCLGCPASRGESLEEAWRSTRCGLRAAGRENQRPPGGKIISINVFYNHRI